MNVLEEIVAAKREEIAIAKAARPQAELEKEAASYQTNRRPFKQLFERGTALIAEIKPKSPAKGELIGGSPLDIADLYEKSEADAISVLTDERFFGGSIELLKQVRARVHQPILRKDFIVDEYQIYETLLSGADAFLLIADVLTAENMTKLMSMGTALGLDYVLEVHDKEDIEMALNTGAELLGINNRDLKSLEIDISTTEKLLKHVPKNIPVISESGIETAADVRRVRSWGVRGILVGTSILQSSDPLEKIRELKAALV